MSFCAAGESVEGRLYRTSFIHLYVSFRSRVSKGGLPHSSVYLNVGNQGNRIKIMIQAKHDLPDQEQGPHLYSEKT